MVDLKIVHKEKTEVPYHLHCDIFLDGHKLNCVESVATVLNLDSTQYKTDLVILSPAGEFDTLYDLLEGNCEIQQLKGEPGIKRYRFSFESSVEIVYAEKQTWDDVFRSRNK